MIYLCFVFFLSFSSILTDDLFDIRPLICLVNLNFRREVGEHCVIQENELNSRYL